MQPLPITADVVIALAGLLPGLLHGRTLFRRGVRLSSRDLFRQARVLVLVGLGFVLVNVIYLPVKDNPVASWYLPVPVEYYGDTVAWTIDLLVMAFMSGAVLIVAVLERHVLRWALPVAAAAVLGTAAYTYHTFHPDTRPDLQRPRIGRDGVILQTNGSTCAAAACANIARVLGMPKTEKEMVELLGTRDDGTSNAEVIHGMRSLGFKCTKRYIRDRDASRLHSPAMLPVDLVGQPDGHAVAYMGQKDGKAEIWDPSGGKQWLTAAELRARWRGRAIEITR